MKFIHIILLCLITAFILGCCESPPNPEVNKRAQQAIATKNPGLCENFTYDYEKNDCYRQVSLGLQDSNVCKNIKSDSSTRDYCFYDFAENTTTFGACVDIGEDYLKAACIGQIAGDKVNNIKSDLESGWDGVKNFFTGNKTNPCESQQTEEQADACHRYAALNSNNPDECSLIRNAERRIDCYRKLAVENKDTYMCMQLETQAEKDTCFYNAAFSGDDPKFCRGVQDRYQKEKCYRQAGINITGKEGYY
ncbi:MAG: hypothetical protein FJY77_01820 [Candidatus Altiarchaeales archaeon]|nr:hypothetical protein [Candidatus Altiarchaeales archaeon]